MRSLSLLMLYIISLAMLVGMGLPVLAENNPPLKLEPLKFEVEPVKRIYSPREGIMVKFTFTANTRTKLCLEKDFLGQMEMSIFRPGMGKMALEPLVVKDNQALFQERIKVHWLEAGESLAVRGNLKRYQFAGGKKWEPGEYSVQAVFNLCEQNSIEEVNDSGKELPIRAARQGWFMITS